jgi:hypothetical protein
MRHLGVAALILSPGLVFCQTNSSPNRGIAARSAPADYPAHVAAGTATYAAALIPASQVKHLFAFDISKSYVVFEIAFYPGSGGAVEIAPDNLMVRSSKTGEAVRPSDPVTVAAAIQQKNLPKRSSETPATVVAGTEVGYESGRDPYTGRRVHDTYTATRVGVGVGGDPGPPRMPSPGGYPQDRELLENQLWDKTLPEGHFDRPVAGYMYFPASLLKKKSSGIYELEYAGQQKIELKLPAK